MHRMIWGKCNRFENKWRHFWCVLKIINIQIWPTTLNYIFFIFWLWPKYENRRDCRNANKNKSQKWQNGSWIKPTVNTEHKLNTNESYNKMIYRGNCSFTGQEKEPTAFVWCSGNKSIRFGFPKKCTLSNFVKSECTKFYFESERIKLNMINVLICVHKNGWH